ncbi:MAG: TldD/PmbA family protein [Bacteroidetes bacterium]|nr:TldD/PmbA family protein [Bacteroidota bacterium]
MGSNISRRIFLERGAKGLITTAFVPAFFKSDSLKAFSSPDGENMKLNEYLNHFLVSEEIIKDVMNTALSKGGDYCDLYFQHQISNYIGLEDGSVNKAYSEIGFGVGIRVLKGNQTGYSFTEDLTPKAMKLAAATAANIAEGSQMISPQQLKLKATPNYYPIKTAWEDIKIDQKIPFLQQINEKVFAADKRIIKSNIWFSDETSYILLATSDGKFVLDYQPMSSISVSCNAEQNGKKEENYFDLNGRRGIEFFTPQTIDRLANEAVRKTVMLFDAVKPEAGEMPVVLAAGSSGILLHEAIGHGMEADFNRKNVSIFSDKIVSRLQKNLLQ